MAGGSGTRMGSSIPKQLLPIGNKPMMMHLIHNAYEIGSNIVLIVSTKNRDIVLGTLVDQGYLGYSSNDYTYNGSTIHICEQPVANGTGGALMATTELLKQQHPDDILLILSADVPLISKQTMLSMFEKIEHPDTKCVLLTKDTIDNYGYGRIVTDNGVFVKIVEQKDCTKDESLITLINTGTYAFKIGPLLTSFQHLNNNNAQNEYYLTDCPQYIGKNVRLVTFIDDSTYESSYDETLGANTPEQLDLLRIEYLKKFRIEKIQDSDINTTDVNLRNLMRVLEQLSSTKFSVKIDDMDVRKVLDHITNMNVSTINKKHLFIVRYEDTIVGTGSVLVEDKLIHDIGRAAHIEDIVIDESYRGLGLAKRLMDVLVQCSKDEGCYKIILDASDDVKGFYEKLGFKQHANSMRLNV